MPGQGPPTVRCYLYISTEVVGVVSPLLFCLYIVLLLAPAFPEVFCYHFSINGYCKNAAVPGPGNQDTIPQHERLKHIYFANASTAAKFRCGQIETEAKADQSRMYGMPSKKIKGWSAVCPCMLSTPRILTADDSVMGADLHAKFAPTKPSRANTQSKKV